MFKKSKQDCIALLNCPEWFSYDVSRLCASDGSLVFQIPISVLQSVNQFLNNNVNVRGCKPSFAHVYFRPIFREQKCIFIQDACAFRVHVRVKKKNAKRILLYHWTMYLKSSVIPGAEPLVLLFEILVV